MIPFDLDHGWLRHPYWPERWAVDNAWVEKAAARVGAPARPRLAEPADAPAIAQLESARFGAIRGSGRHHSCVYDPAIFAENRQGWLLRLVAEDEQGCAAYAIGQVRQDSLYLYEGAAAPGRGHPGHTLFRTFAHLADLLDLPQITTVVSRLDRGAAILRAHARLGMKATPMRGLGLTGTRIPNNWAWLSGDTPDVVARATATAPPPNDLKH